jgi:predicted N-formylglutamate amidohydrolase
MTWFSAGEQSRPAAVIITCEHGGYKVPAEYRPQFAAQAEVLAGHRGWDLGALTLAKQFSTQLQAPLHQATVTRLLVELNRSLHHPKLFSEFTCDLLPEQKTRILDQYWHPYRNSVESQIADWIAQARCVLHLSVHSFVPVLNGQARRTDVGLLYDPQRSGERRFCAAWQAAIRQAAPEFTVHRNAPYRGTSDGFVTHLRQRFSEGVYVGLELEVKHSLLQPATKSGSSLASKLIHSFQQTLISGNC